MALSITVNGAGTFTASMEEGPVSFTASLGAVPGPKGDAGPAGIVAATAPITYNSGTQTVGIDPSYKPNPFDQSLNTSDEVDFIQATVNKLYIGNDIVFADSTSQTTAFVGEARKVYITARNSTGSTIAKGKVVYLSGGTGNVPNVSLALADAESTSSRTIGITAAAISNNSNGKVITSGSVENIDTSAFSDGDTVYLSATTAGGLTTTLPTQPLHGVVIGIVTRANPSVGSIEVAINNYQELKELSDVAVSDRANNDGLFWESSSSTWRSKTVAEVLGLTPISLSSLSASAPISYNSGTGAFTFDSSGYLLKADNLSGLASASTARTNLGLGTMAVETASNYLTTATASTTYQTQAGMSSYLTSTTAASTYQTQAGMSSYALLASPTFSGTPSLPTGTTGVTQTTGNSTTRLATTAFVQQEVPTASTSAAGKVELATDAENLAGTSTALATTPWGNAWGRMNPSFMSFTATDASSLTSGGTSAVSSHGLMTRSGTASGSYGGRVFEGGASIGIFTNTGSGTGFDFSKRVFFSGKIQVNSSAESANIAQRVTFGKRGSSPSGTDIGDLAVRGFGIRMNGAGTAATLTVHNGTSLSNVTSTFTPSAGITFDFIIYSDGAGNVTLYVNGSSVATSANGPTGTSTGIVPTVYCETVATSTVTTATNTTLLVSNIKLDAGT